MKLKGLKAMSVGIILGGLVLLMASPAAYATTTAPGTTTTVPGTTSSGKSNCPPNKKPPPYPPGQCHLTVSSTSIQAGGTLQVSGSGFAANTLISFTLDPGSIAIGTLYSDSSGAVNGSITIPSSVSPGSYTDIKASGMDPNGFGYALWSDPITITNGTAAISATPASSHPALSTPVGLGALLLLLALGSGLVVNSRRRDHDGRGTSV